MAARRPTSRARTTPAPQGGLTRVHVVWMSFLAAMTIVGVMLLVIDGQPSPRADGVSLSPLASATLIGSTNADPLTQTRVPLDHSRWQAIMIHHSGSMRGDPASIAKEQNDRSPGHNILGLGHHFIIGNGNGMDDGQVHIGFRWLDQLPGAHFAGPKQFDDFYTQHAISICLVGDGNRYGFTQAQIQQLSTLVDSLCKQLGIPRDHVILHSDIAPVADPGKLFPAGLYGLPAGKPGR